MTKKKNATSDAPELRRRAESRLSAKEHRAPQTGSDDRHSVPDANRLLHELQVHEIELEMQNEELKLFRDRAETLLEKYTDLYDFAPVGYFSLDKRGWIAEVNLTGAALLGEERSRLINGPLTRFVSQPDRLAFLDFLKRVFTEAGSPACELTLLKVDGTLFPANLHGLAVSITGGAGKRCRMTVSDITSRKLEEETRQRLEALATSNQKLLFEITKRRVVEKSLKSSEKRQRQTLQQLRTLSHRILQVQEEERKRISRELHDEISQVLTGINIHLENLAQNAVINPEELKKQITTTQRLVEKSVDRVHQFARELRPSTLDDLGLIVAFKAGIAEFRERTNIDVTFTACAEVEQLNSDRRTVLYRITQEALKNIASHAHASKVKIRMTKSGRKICLEVSDNGQAFEVERVLLDKNHKRLGLIGMRERAEMVGGTFRIASTPGKGTTIQTRIPFQIAAPEVARP